MLNFPYEPYFMNTICFSVEADYWSCAKCYSSRTFKNYDIESMVSETRLKNKSMLQDFIKKNKEKLKYFYDMSYIAFYICINERTEQWFVTCTIPYGSSDFDSKAFSELKLEDKLKFLEKECEFIPVTLIYEDIDVYDGESHLWSHIKEDEHAMKDLESYLSGLQFQPRDNIWYILRLNKHGDVYLERDLTLSPRNKK